MPLRLRIRLPGPGYGAGYEAGYGAGPSHRPPSPLHFSPPLPPHQPVFQYPRPPPPQQFLPTPQHSLPPPLQQSLAPLPAGGNVTKEPAWPTTVFNGLIKIIHRPDAYVVENYDATGNMQGGAVLPRYVKKQQ